MMRERFEKWAVPHGYPTDRDMVSGLYRCDATHDAWNGYQSAKADELAFLESRVATVVELNKRIAELKERAVVTDEMVNRACDVFYGETFTDAHGGEGRKLVRAMLEAALASQSEAVTGSLIELDGVKFAVPSKVARKIKAALAVDPSKLQRWHVFYGDEEEPGENGPWIKYVDIVALFEGETK